MVMTKLSVNLNHTGYTSLSPATDNSLLDITTLNEKSNKAGQLEGSNWRSKLKDQTANRIQLCYPTQSDTDATDIIDEINLCQESL